MSKSTFVSVSFNDLLLAGCTVCHHKTAKPVPFDADPNAPVEIVEEHFVTFPDGGPRVKSIVADELKIECNGCSTDSFNVVRKLVDSKIPFTFN